MTTSNKGANYEHGVSRAASAAATTEWLDGGTRAILLDGKATNGQLMIGS